MSIGENEIAPLAIHSWRRVSVSICSSHPDVAMAGSVDSGQVHVVFQTAFDLATCQSLTLGPILSFDFARCGVFQA